MMNLYVICTRIHNIMCKLIRLTMAYRYLGQMLEKGGVYVVGIFSDGLILSPNLLKLHNVFSLAVSMSLKNIS